MTTTIKVPPDGGYGWVIVLANALSNLIIIPMMQSFGLIFKETFSDMGLSATQQSLIINLNAAFGMIMGLVNGVLLKVFGYRKIAIAASVLVTLGIILTSFATTFTHFMITYGLITSLGFGMNMSAYSLALNSYFKKKKSSAVSYAMTLTGLGPILMPQFINLLIQYHTVQGVTLILGGVVANGFVAASLLQPVKWHLKTEIVEDETVDLDEEEVPEKGADSQKMLKYERSMSVPSKKHETLSKSSESLNDIENAPIFGMDSALAGSVISLHSVKRRVSTVSQTWKKSSNSSINKNRDSVYNPEMSRLKKKESHWKRFFARCVKFFDLDLLKDPIYVNILIGLSVAIFAEINFSLLTAYILDEFGLDTNQIATFMSVLGIADIIFRFLAPYVGKLVNLPARQMYGITLVMLMLSRYSLLLSNNFVVLIGIAFGLGVAKGFRTVYMSLVIPLYVPIEKLASASGLQMMINGICILIGGPIIGVIRDITGNYILCIIVLNFITMTTIVLWSIEGVIVIIKKKQTKVKSIEQTNSLLNKT